tara:strand:+ start:90 stop:419 length:330 start_codon:yes stop_codon:yes gene_type:complete
VARGPYNTSRKSAEPDHDRALKVNATFDDLRNKILEESPLKSEAAKLAAADSAATLYIQQGHLKNKLSNGTITADELRQIPAVANQINKILATLGIIELHEEDLDFTEL